MEPYSKTENYSLYLGNMLDVLDTIDENSIDSIITDPPYELNFMGKGWDNAGVSFNKETWEKCLRVLKPGGYLLAFGGSRTYHRIACAIEDAGFEIRDTIMWLYGCLSEDTEILTDSGFKSYHKITKDDKIAIYDTTKCVFKWEIPERWQAYDVEQDTAYRIKSDSTDQIVSRNHRCIVEQNGKLVFKFAENLSKMERVPILPQDFCVKTESGGEILQLSLCGKNENLAKTVCRQWERQEKPQERVKNGKEPCLEGGSNLSQEKGELCLSENKICKMSKRVCDNGEKGWLCNGTPTSSSTENRAATIENRDCSSCKSQCRRQQNREPDAIQEQQRPQEIRTRSEYTTTLATIEKIEYTGVFFCPTVSTGAFVARRNGKVFITGNSGFPKSMNIGLAIDKKNGVESEIVGERKQLGAKFKLTQELIDNGGFNDPNRTSFAIKKASNEWQGWGTALKPSFEPIIVARKPFKGSCVDNVLEYGVGGLNIDGCRIAHNEPQKFTNSNPKDGEVFNTDTSGYDNTKNHIASASPNGRFPANTILTYDETDFDEVCGGFPQSKGGSGKGFKKDDYDFGDTATNFGRGDFKPYNDNGSAARYFYCAKASKKDRDEGLEEFEEKNTMCDRNPELASANMPQNRSGNLRKNTHPTVKPTTLMQYLIRLVSPKGAIILDPFMGSGSTGKAVVYENKERDADYKFTGIEMTEEYLPIAEARIKYAKNS